MNASRFLPKDRLDDLIAALRGGGYRVVGPTVRDGGVLFDEIERVADLPIGQRDEQDAGRYRLSPGSAGEIFGVVNGAGSLKPLFFAPEEPLLTVRRERRGFSVEEVVPPAVKLAVLGVRACDLAALAVQDRVFLHDRFRDTHYAARRADTLLIAVNCTRAAATCFCASMASGPKATRGFDLSSHRARRRVRRRVRQRGGRCADRLARRAAARVPRRTSATRRSAASPTARTASGAGSTRAICRVCSTRTSTTRAGTTSRSAASRARTARWSARPASATPSSTSPS